MGAGCAGAVLASLQQLQEAAGRCRIRHWLLRVLSARDVRLQLAAAFVSVAAALEGLSTAAAASVLADDLPRSHLSALSQLQQGVASHKLTRHEPLEALARGLLKHVTDDRTDQEQLPSMLKYVVKQAALQTHTAPAAASDAAAAGSSSSAAASSSSKAGASSSSNGAGSSRAAAEGASSSSSSSRRAGCDGLPAGEASLTDTELLMVLEQLAASKASEEQLALYQILSILEGLQEAKRQQQREHHRKRAQRRQQQQQQPLQRVSEADDDTSTIAAVRDASTASAAAAAGTAYTAAAAAAGCSSNPAGGAEQPSACVSEVVAAMMAQLEEMLWRDPWDAVALTQLLELLLQVQPEEEEQEQEGAENGSEADSDSTAGGGNQHSRDSKMRQDQGSKQAGKKGKWWQASQQEWRVCGGLHNILAGSFWDEVPGAAEDLATVLLQVMEGTDTLAAARAAQLAASLAGDVLWEGRRGAWLQACRAGLKLLATRSGSTAASARRGGYSSTGGLRADTGSSVSSATSSRARASGAVLLVQLVGSWQGAGGGGRQALHATQQRVSPMLAAQVEAAAQQDLLFEALQLCVQQFRGSGSWQGLDELPQGGGGASSIDVLVNCEGAAAVRLLDALLCWLPDQAWCAVPDLYATVAPVLEHLAATQHGWLQAAARRTHELLLGVAG
ncbi:hypothetical protein OEZ86_013289 [Tetradesmus obliquus]|nr:hypothetical protein OEZ86_013289 [Tetradesmus obliquus]